MNTGGGRRASGLHRRPWGGRWGSGWCRGYAGAGRGAGNDGEGVDIAGRAGGFADVGDGFEHADLVGGTDFTWRWLRLGAEYEEYDSSFTQYDSWRFYQTGSWQPFDNSTFSLDFSESFYRYPDDSNQTRYQAVGRYNLQLSAALAWYAEGGYSLQDIMGTEQNYGSARTGLSWVRGKLNFRTGYEYNAQMTLTGAVREERDRNYFFVYLKRTF